MVVESLWDRPRPRAEEYGRYGNGGVMGDQHRYGGGGEEGGGGVKGETILVNDADGVM